MAEFRKSNFYQKKSNLKRLDLGLLEIAAILSEGNNIIKIEHHLPN